jgi:two-component system response regulator DevR
MVRQSAETREFGPVSVLVIDDREAARARTVQVLQEQRGAGMAVTVSSTPGAVAALVARRPDIAVIDASPANDFGLHICRTIAELGAPTRPVVITDDSSERTVRQALLAGVRGYLLESEPAELGSALRNVVNGQLVLSPRIVAQVRRQLADCGASSPELRPEPALTRRETEVLHHLSSGSRNREIAERLSISSKTVEAHLRNVFIKLGVNTRTQAAVHALRSGPCRGLAQARDHLSRHARNGQEA